MLFCLVIVQFSIKAQSKYDSEIAELINKNRWFELNKYYTQHKDSLSDFMNLCSASLLNNYFNNPKDAIANLEIFTDKYAMQLGAENINFACILAENYANNKEFDKAAAIYESLGQQLMGILPMESLKKIKGNRDRHQFYASIPILEMTKTVVNNDIIIPINIFEGGIFLDIHHKGQSYNTIFDTGSSINIVSDVYAEKMGLIPLLDSVIINDSLLAKIAIADSINIGSILFKNVPFAIIESNKVLNVRVDSLDGSAPLFEIVLGIEIMKLLEEVHFDFSRKQMTIPKMTSLFDGCKNMIYIDNMTYINIHIDDSSLLVFYDSGYFGDFTIANNFNIGLLKKENSEVKKQKFLNLNGVNEIELIELDNTKIKIKDQEFVLPVSYIGYIQNTHADAMIGKTFSDISDSLIINFKDMWIKCK